MLIVVRRSFPAFLAFCFLFTPHRYWEAVGCQEAPSAQDSKSPKSNQPGPGKTEKDREKDPKRRDSRDERLAPLERALETLDYATQLVSGFPRPEGQVSAYALLGEAWWNYDEERGRASFRSAWDALKKVEVKPGSSQPADKEIESWKGRTRQGLLTRIARLDHDLAQQLLRSERGPQAASAGDTKLDSQEGIGLVFQRAYSLLESDPSAAASLAEQTLVTGVPPWFGSFLQELQSRDGGLATRLFEVALRVVVRNRPPLMAELFSLSSFAFPGLDQGGQGGNAVVAHSFLVVLASALEAEVNPPVPGATQMTRSEQVYILTRYLPLYERFAPDLAPAVRALLVQLQTPSKPPQPNNKPESPPQAQSPLGPTPANQQMTDALKTLEGGDIAGAQQLALKLPDPHRRQAMLDQLNSQQVEKSLGADQIDEAIRYAQQIKDPRLRAEALVDIAGKLAARKQSAEALKHLSDAQAAIASMETSLIKAHLSLGLVNAVATLDSNRALECTRDAVTTINRLFQGKPREKSPDSLAGLSLSDRQTLQASLAHTFSVIGRADMEQAIYWAAQIENAEQRVHAEIAVCRPVLESGKKKSADPAVEKTPLKTPTP